MKNRYFFIITALVIFWDQLSKIIVRSTMDIYQIVPILGNYFRLRYVTNTGAAFSMSTGSLLADRWILTAVGILASALLVYLLIKQEHVMPKVCLALILGGALGNLIDRVIYGKVTDFLDSDFPDFIMERWPVFNVADSSIVIAIIIYIVYIVFLEKYETRSGEE